MDPSIGLFAIERWNDHARVFDALATQLWAARHRLSTWRRFDSLVADLRPRRRELEHGTAPSPLARSRHVGAIKRAVPRLRKILKAEMPFRDPLAGAYAAGAWEPMTIPLPPRPAA